MFLRYLMSGHLMADSDANAGGGSGKPDPKAEAKPDPDKDRLAKLEAANKEMSDRLAKTADDDKAKKEAAKRAKAEEDGKLKGLVDEQAARLDAAEKENEHLRKSFIDRADAQIKGLAEAEQKRLASYKERVAVDVWLSMVDDAVSAAATIGGEKPKAPPASGGSDALAGDKGKKHKATERTKEFLVKGMLSDATAQLEDMDVVVDETSGAYKFVKPIERMFQGMNVPRPSSFKPAKTS